MTYKNANSNRHTNPTAAGLEDALAISVDVLLEVEQELQYLEARIAQLQEVLQILRSGPYAYDQDRPAGPKIRVHKRIVNDENDFQE